MSESINSDVGEAGEYAAGVSRSASLVWFAAIVIHFTTRVELRQAPVDHNARTYEVEMHQTPLWEKSSR